MSSASRVLDHHLLSPLVNMRQDLSFALRTLRKNPAFALPAIATLALGIGANTAVFSVVQSVLLQPLPVHRLDRLAVVYDSVPGLNLASLPLVPPIAADLDKHTELFGAGGGFVAGEYTLTGAGIAQHLEGAMTTGDPFRVFDVRPVLGRFYTPDEREPGRQFVVVISEKLWRRQFGGAPDVLGRKIDLNGRPYAIVGVLPQGYEYPRTAELWKPLPRGEQEQDSVITYVARLRDGLSFPELGERLRIEAIRQAQEFGVPPGFRRTMLAVPFRQYIAGQLRPILLVLLATTSLVLLIACANVASLLLVRATGRAREFAVRAAIGASRWSLVRQSMIESLLLCLGGGLLGTLGARLLLDTCAQLRPWELPVSSVTLDGTVLGFAAVVSLISSLLFGLAPALRASRPDVSHRLHDAGRGSTLGSSRHQAMSAFVVLQVALALLLLTGSGLLIRSLGHLLSTSPGFHAEQVITARFTLPDFRYPQPSTRAAFYTQLDQRLRAMPGVNAVGITSALPLSGQGGSTPFTIPGRPQPPGAPMPHANRRSVTPGYFRAMGIPLLRGRLFEDADASSASPVAIIDEQLARKYFPHEDPIGKQIEQLGHPVIIGVVGSVKHSDVTEEWKETVYYPMGRYPALGGAIAVRTVLPEPTAANLLSATVAETDVQVPLYEIQLMQFRLDRSLAPRRMAVLLMTGFAAIAVLLSVLGIYGVLSYATTRRTQEIGVRLALGATPAAIRRTVLSRGATLLVTGLIAGLTASLVLTRFLVALLYGVTPHDPLTLVASVILLTSVALLACYAPARRASRVDPIHALRYE